MFRSFHPRHALITGAAGAIGGCLSRRIAAQDGETKLTLVDRDRGAIDRLASEWAGRSQSIAWNLGEVATLDLLWKQATEKFGPVDLLINCAGFMEIISFGATEWSVGKALLDVDLVCPLRLMNLAVAEMPAAGGWIVNVSSMAGVVPIRGCTYYGAAKSGLAMASEIAALELAPHGVQVVTVYPGPIYSELERHARGQVPQGFVSRNIPTGEPDQLARRIVRALESGETRVVYPRPYRVAHGLIKVSSWVTSRFSPVPSDRE